MRAKIARIRGIRRARSCRRRSPSACATAYLNVGEIMANRQGEVNFPINAKFPASKAADAMRAFEAFVADNRAILDHHDIRVRVQLAAARPLLGHRAGGLLAPAARAPTAMHYATEDRRAAQGAVEDPETTAAAIDFRHG